jgi:hypothetical protein
VPVPTAAGTLSKLEQSSLHEAENKEVSVPTADGALSKLGQSSLPDPENKEVSVPTAAFNQGPGSSRYRYLFVFWLMQ